MNGISRILVTGQTLESIFKEFPFQILQGCPDSTPISQVVSDSRKVEPGDLFVATMGNNFDAHRFIPQALEKGAAAIVGMSPGIDLVVPYIQIENTRHGLAHLAAAAYGFPAREMTIVGVTGTDGKTTTCNILYEIMVAAGYKTGMITSVNAIIGDEIMDTGFHVTTPDALDVQSYLARMLDAGLTHVILETTSHGWAQYRVDACEIDIGIVTNITHEHLDEHGSYSNYRAAKARLFESLTVTHLKARGNPRLAVLNADDLAFDYLKSITTTDWISYGKSSHAQVSPQDIQIYPDSTRFTAVGPNWATPVTTTLVGDFNIFNILAALTAAIVGLEIPLERVTEGIANLAGIPGRMERIELGQTFTALVDFAHTPNALMNAIQTARGMTDGRVIVVFGSAGLRDREKRKMMAEVSTNLADLSIFTTEDPRTESLKSILKEMAVGAEGVGGVEGKTFWRIADRGDAFRFSLGMAEPGDVVMACGKGHEQSMCFGTTEYPWDDRIAMRAALAELLNVDGPEMPVLPTGDGSG